MGSTNGMDRKGRGKGLSAGVFSAMVLDVQYWMEGSRDRKECLNRNSQDADAMMPR
jgi:hypothetical protein